jgi:tetratricopeptide (TPR) repeat protein
MRYRCLACDHVFEADDSEKRPRCPRCMGIHDVEPLKSGGGEKRGAKGGRGGRSVAVLLVLAAAAAVAYYLLREPDEGGKEAEEALEPESLADALEERGVPADDVVLPFEVSGRIERLAERVAGDAEGAGAVQTLLDELGRLQKDKSWKPFHQRSLSTRAPLTADELLAAIESETDDPPEATSYEATCLLLAAARAAGVSGARMARIYSFEGEDRPADPTGRYGRFAVALGGDGESSPRLFEPHDLRSGKSAAGESRVLSDVEAAAPYYHEKALSLLVERDTAAAFRANDAAIRLDPDCAAYRVGRGMIFVISGAPDEALAEYEKAIKRRDDAVRRVLLADLLIKLGDPGAERAEGEVRAAIEKMSGYAQAHAVLGQIYAIRGELETAESELSLAEKLDPRSPDISMSWAMYHLLQGDSERAIERAEQAVRLSDGGVDSLIALAGVYKQTARFDEMRETLDRLGEAVGSEKMAEEIERLFGYSPGEGEELAESEGDAGAGELALGPLPDAGIGDLELELGKGRKSEKPGLGVGGLGGSLGGGLGGGMGGGGLGGGLELKMGGSGGGGE